MSIEHEAWYREALTGPRVPKFFDPEREHPEENPPEQPPGDPEGIPSLEEQGRQDLDRLRHALLEKLMPLVLQSLRETGKVLGPSQRLSTLWSDAVRMTQTLEELLGEESME